MAKTVQTVQELVKDTRSEAGNPVQFTIERGGEFYDTTLTPRENPPEGEGRIGINLADPLIASVTVTNVLSGFSGGERWNPGRVTCSSAPIIARSTTPSSCKPS